MMKRIIYCCFSLLAVAAAQAVTIPDSLKGKNYEYLKERYHETKREGGAMVYAKTWLAKAKAEKNLTQIIVAYQAILHTTDKKEQLLYADSIVQVARRTKDDAQIGSAYLTKGSVYYHLKRQSSALDNYFIADGYISITNDSYLKFKTKYAIAQTKYYLGFYEESISLFKDCLPFFEQENDRAYLNTLHHIGLCYNKLKRFDLCSSYNQMGLQAGREFDNDEMVDYFNHSEGVNQFYLHNYEKSIKLLSGSLPVMKSRGDFANEIVAWFYLGKNYSAMGRNQMAMSFFKKVDEVIADEEYIRPDLRENFEILINHYKNQGNLREQLFYVNRLLHVDSILHADFRYLSGKIHKEYDTKKLRQDKQDIENTLRLNKIASASVIGLLIVLITFLSYRYYKREQQYRKKFEELIANNLEIVKPTIKVEHPESLGIAEEVVSAILKKLDKFEQGTKFLETDMSSRKLADILNTNTKYVSKIIPKYRGTKTIDYISDLKIRYMVTLLKNEKIYRKYTNKALAEIAGFGSTQNFTKAFKARTGIAPTGFIEELQKKEQNPVSL